MRAIQFPEYVPEEIMPMLEVVVNELALQYCQPGSPQATPTDISGKMVLVVNHLSRDAEGYELGWIGTNSAANYKANLEYLAMLSIAAWLDHAKAAKTERDRISSERAARKFAEFDRRATEAQLMGEIEATSYRAFRKEISENEH